MLIRNRLKMKLSDEKIEDIQREYRTKFSQRTLLDDIKMEHRDENSSIPDLSLNAATPNRVAAKQSGFMSRLSDSTPPFFPDLKTQKGFSQIMSPHNQSQATLFQAKKSNILKHHRH